MRVSEVAVVIRVIPSLSVHGLGAHQCYTTSPILLFLPPGYIVATSLQTTMDLHESLVTPLPCCRCVVAECPSSFLKITRPKSQRNLKS